MLAMLLLNRMSTTRRTAKKKQVIKSVKTEKKVSIDHCRTCLSTEDLVAIFYNKDTETKRTEDLRLVTGLEIKMNDGLSQKICTQCIEMMNQALQFRRTSRKAEKTLLGMLGGTKQKKKSSKLQKALKPSLSKAKEEKVEFEDYNYNYDDMFADDFQNDFDYANVKEEAPKPKIKQKAVTTRKKRAVLPNATTYKCATCSKEFKMKATYKAHMRFHTNYCVCESCGKRCRNNNQLQEHKRARHGLGRIHKCAYCEYSSATKEALTIHERRHTGERPYICDHCGATFHRRSNLVQHIAIHLPEKNFQCDMCPKRLKSRKFLQIHVHNAHTGRRYGYLCPVCKHRFEKPNKVRAHVRRVHGVPDEQQGPIVRVQL
ncbi:zinc finger protein 91-like isoform X2 [Pectinophora gossypiella]|uniref:zinc finger protein 91-like isoform X2 n=2 Tax=Pectinophora gossypiella TaxID=13191 RepID=UPI00214E5196|nr:zinc finger protein 91-like isoform X2 [Pectinophora gossypiella]